MGKIRITDFVDDYDEYDELYGGRQKITKKIADKAYSASEVNSVIESLKENINKINFNKTDIKNASKKVKQEYAKNNNSLNPLNDL